MNFYKVFTYFVFLNFCCAFAQDKGFILDSERKGISSATIFFADINLEVYSKDDGSFTIPKDIPANSLVEIKKSGYISQVIQFNTNKKFELILESLHIQLDEVEIIESTNQLGNTKLVSVEKKVLNDLSTTSLVENITQLSGVNWIGSGQGIQKIVVRGLSGMRVVTYLNGMRIENQQWANDHGIGFTELGLSEVELIKGSSALKYGGEAVGGLLYFKDAPFLESEKLSGFISTKFDNSHFSYGNKFGLKWSKNKFYFNLYGQYTIATDYRLPDNTYLYNSRFRNQGIKFSASYRSNKIQHIFRYQHNAEQLGIPAHVCDPTLGNIELTQILSDEISLSEDYDLSVIRPIQNVSNHLFIYESNYFINNNKFSLHIGHFINNLKEYEKVTFPAFDMDLISTQFRLNLRKKIKDYTINIGSQATRNSNKNYTVDYLIPDGLSSDIGLYSILDYEKNNLGFNAGARFDFKEIVCDSYNFQNTFSSLSSSLGMYYKYKDHVFRLTYSGAFRSPHLSELFSDGVHHGTNRYELGNESLDIEKGRQFDLKYQWSSQHFGIVLNPFLQFIQDYISIEPMDSIIQNNRVFNYTQFDQVKLSGFEMHLHYHPHFMHNLHLEQTYSFVETKNQDSNRALALTPSNKIKTKIRLDFNQNRLGFFKSISLYHTYSFEQKNVSQFELPSDEYNLVNIDIAFDFFKKIDFILGVANLFNEEYVPHLSRIKDVPGVPTGIPNPGRSFNINLRYTF